MSWSWQTLVLISVQSLNSSLVFASDTPPQAPKMGCLAQAHLELSAAKAREMLEDPEHKRALFRELLSGGNYLNKPENTLQFVINQLSFSSRVPIEKEMLSKAPFDWQVIERKLSPNGQTLTLTVKNSSLGETHELTLPWDQFFEQQERHFNRPAIQFKYQPRHWSEQFKDVSEAERNADFKLAYQAQEESSSAYTRGAKATESVVIDFLVHQKDEILSADRTYPQYLLWLAERSREASASRTSNRSNAILNNLSVPISKFATPCSVKAIGANFLCSPRPFFKITICDLKGLYRAARSVSPGKKTSTYG